MLTLIYAIVSMITKQKPVFVEYLIMGLIDIILFLLIVIILTPK